MRLRRRDLLVGTFTALGFAGVLPACSDDATTPDVETGPDVGALAVDASLFAHGVASGDPLSDRVILWTRVTVDQPVTVHWVVAADPALSSIVARGSAEATADADYTVKVDPTGLAPATTYYYAFAVEGRGRSVVGRTKTLPEGRVDHLRFAVTSCANYNNGWFNAYARIADRNDLDLWIHLGDYIYEYADAVYGNAAKERRFVPAGETITLDDYRKRYALYRTDPDLQEIHRQHPLVAIWDDHEVANDSSRDGAENHGEGEGDYQARKLAGARAFVEWLPIRVPAGEGLPKINRTFSLGDLVDLVMIDTRLAGRDPQIGENDVVAGTDKGTPEQWADPARKLLDDAQEAWLLGELTASKARGTAWRFLGNQVIFAPTKDPRDQKVVSTDFWDGYQASRARVVSHLRSGGIDNFVVLTGDIHTSWAMDIPADVATYDKNTGAGSVGVELVCPAVTSQALEGDPLASVAPGLLQNANPHLFFNEVTRKGYVLVDVTRERIQGEWWFVGDHLTKNATEELWTLFACASGTAHLTASVTPSSPKAAPPRVT